MQRLKDMLEVTMPYASCEASFPIAKKQKTDTILQKKMRSKGYCRYIWKKRRRRCLRVLRRNWYEMVEDPQTNIKKLLGRRTIFIAAVKSNDKIAIVQVSQLVHNQKWTELAVMNNSAHGRSIMATDVFERGIILLGYHGNMEDPLVTSEYPR